ncbi:MAG: hypothetical protein R3B82_22365 [Sandaracinaceae bacterium]
MTVRELFEQLGSLPTELSWVCLDPKGLTANSLVLVYARDQLEPHADYPAEAVRLGMTRDVGVLDVEDVVANAREQGLEPTLQQFVEALAFYAEHDAFKEWRDWRADPRSWPERRPSTSPIDRSQPVLLIAVDGNVGDVLATRMEDMIAPELARVTWRLHAPLWVNEYDESSCTRPEDAPIRTTGVCLSLPIVDDPDTERAQLADLGAVLEIMQSVSRAKGLPFVMELDGDHVGSIVQGELDDDARELLGSRRPG